MNSMYLFTHSLFIHTLKKKKKNQEVNNNRFKFFIKLRRNDLRDAHKIVTF